mmetsp:Transcript_37755/g.43394  ORF Transcript_37755/g.43394 Transcript_37755/m.43394 type:complete len:218 (-) Transcript_37755:184-837(-)
MMSEEYEVSLVVQGYHLLSFEIWSLRKQCSQHSSDSMTNPGVKVVQYQLWVSLHGVSMIKQLFVAFDIRDSKGRSWAFWQMTKNQSVRLSLLLVNNHNVCIVSIFSPLDNIFNLKVLSLIVMQIWNHGFELLHELEHSSVRSSICDHDDLWCGLLFEVLIELVDILVALDFLVLLCNEGLVKNTHSFNGICDTSGKRVLALLKPDLLLLEAFKALLL